MKLSFNVPDDRHLVLGTILLHMKLYIKIIERNRWPVFVKFLNEHG